MKRLPVKPATNPIPEIRIELFTIHAISGVELLSAMLDADLLIALPKSPNGYFCASEVPGLEALGDQEVYAMRSLVAKVRSGVDWLDMQEERERQAFLTTLVGERVLLDRPGWREGIRIYLHGVLKAQPACRFFITVGGPEADSHVSFHVSNVKGIQHCQNHWRITLDPVGL